MTPDPNTVEHLRSTINRVWKNLYGGDEVDSFQLLASRVNLMEAEIEEKRESVIRLLVGTMKHRDET